MSPQLIVPCLWFDAAALDAARLYTSLFDNSRLCGNVATGEASSKLTGLDVGTPLTVEFEIAGFRIVGLNGGPMFKLNPSISFFVICETEEEIDRLWEKLAEGGLAMMPLAKQEWSEKYGWVCDRFGVNWQIALGKLSDVGQKITPSFMFVGEQYGRGEEAVNLYTSIFPRSSIDGILRHEAGGTERAGSVKHAQFALQGEKFMIMENAYSHAFNFNEAFSLMIHVETQADVDYYWSKLVADGGQESQCGWLKDKFGVSWQVVPRVLHTMISDPDRAKADRVTAAFMQMKKFDIAELERAYQGA